MKVRPGERVYGKFKFGKLVEVGDAWGPYRIPREWVKNLEEQEEHERKLLSAKEDASGIDWDDGGGSWVDRKYNG